MPGCHGFDSGLTHSLLRGGRNHDCEISQEMRRPLLRRKIIKVLIIVKKKSRYQLENPGFDFSGATLDKKYDDFPGLSLMDDLSLAGKI
jgi:hypothetical protein